MIMIRQARHGEIRLSSTEGFGERFNTFSLAQQGRKEGALSCSENLESQLSITTMSATIMMYEARWTCKAPPLQTTVLLAHRPMNILQAEPA